MHYAIIALRFSSAWGTDVYFPVHRIHEKVVVGRTVTLLVDVARPSTVGFVLDHE